MRHTSFSDKKYSVQGYNVPDIVTTGYDMEKFLFAAHNGGVYAGKRVFSPYTAQLILKLKDLYLKK